MKLKISKMELSSNPCLNIPVIHKQNISSMFFRLLKPVHINWRRMITIILKICSFTISYYVTVFQLNLFIRLLKLW